MLCTYIGTYMHAYLAGLKASNGDIRPRGCKAFWELNLWHNEAHGFRNKLPFGLRHVHHQSAVGVEKGPSHVPLLCPS